MNSNRCSGHQIAPEIKFTPSTMTRFRPLRNGQGNWNCAINYDTIGLINKSEMGVEVGRALLLLLLVQSNIISESSNNIYIVFTRRYFISLSEISTSSNITVIITVSVPQCLWSPTPVPDDLVLKIVMNNIVSLHGVLRLDI